jgi:LmbE family N-acetylglucosaminyl deacetylase
LGHEAVLLYLNKNEWNGVTAEQRMPEARKACEILKARPIWTDQKTGYPVIDHPHYEEWAKIIEAEKADVLFTQWPLDKHQDHRAAAVLTFGAWVGSNRKFSLYYYEVTNGEDTVQFSPTHYVDITGTEPIKHAACYAHATATPDIFYPIQDQVANFRGVEGGFKKAEAFLLQLQSPSDPLRQLGLC